MNGDQGCMTYVCPLPRYALKIRSGLMELAKREQKLDCEPPLPLAVAGWTHSSDADKRANWLKIYAWAKERGLEHAVPELSREQQYWTRGSLRELELMEIAYDQAIDGGFAPDAFRKDY